MVYTYNLKELIAFLVTKKRFKSSLDSLYFHLSIIEFRIEEKIYTKAVVETSRDTGGRVFLFSWEILGTG